MCHYARLQRYANLKGYPAFHSSNRGLGWHLGEHELQRGDRQSGAAAFVEGVRKRRERQRNSRHVVRNGGDREAVSAVTCAAVRLEGARSAS